MRTSHLTDVHTEPEYEHKNEEFNYQTSYTMMVPKAHTTPVSVTHTVTTKTLAMATRTLTTFFALFTLVFFAVHKIKLGNKYAISILQ